MWKNKFVKYVLAAFVFCIVSCGIASGRQVLAYTPDYNSTITKKILAQNVYYCYQKGAIKNEIEMGQAANFAALLSGASKDISIIVPLGITEDGYGTFTCHELFQGRQIGSQFSGLVSIYKPALADKMTESSLTSLGYTTKSKSMPVLSPTFAYDGKMYKTEKIIFNTNTQGKIVSMYTDSTDIDYTGVFFSVENNNLYLKTGISAGKRALILSSEEITSLTPEQAKTKVEDRVKSTIGIYNPVIPKDSNQQIIFNTSDFYVGDIKSEYKSSGEYNISDFKNAGRKAANYFTNISTNETPSLYSFGLSKSEQIHYYVDALNDVFYEGKNNYWICGSDNLKNDSNFIPIGVSQDGNQKTDNCYLDKSKVLAGYNEPFTLELNRNTGLLRTNGVGGTTIYSKVEQVAQRINDLAAEVSNEALAAAVATDSATTEVQTDPCYTEAGSMGWLLCPLIKNIGDLLGDIYENCVEPFLQIDGFLTSTDSGTYEAWKVFVGIGNALVIIFLLVVIFSQLTGVGISNYGIKKSLPKLIAVIILVNLSFIICQLLIDLSNILGSSLDLLLTNIGRNVQDSVQLQDGTTVALGGGGWFRALLDSLLVAGGVSVALTAVVGVQSAKTGGSVLSSLVVPIVIAIIGALIAILFFFILLGLRKIAIIVLVIISPLAFVCYMLPNTKKLFDKWWNLFKAMLLIYPVAGLLIGASNLISSILVANSTNDFFFYFINMLLMVVPFFFIPSLVKSSMGALGMFSSKLSDFGKRFGGRMQKGLGKANDLQWMKEHNQRAQYNAAQKAKKKYQDKYNQAELAARQKYEANRKPGDKEWDKLDDQEKARRVSKELGWRKTQRLAASKEHITGYDAKLDKAALVSAAGYTDAENNKNQTANANADKDLRTWGQKDPYFVDKKGKTWVRQPNGEYARFSKDGKLLGTKSSSEIHNMQARGEGRFMTRGEAELNKADIGLAQQMGGLAGYATTQSRINRAKNAATRSAAQSSIDSTNDTIQSGNSSVLKVKHDKHVEQQKSVQIEAEEGYTPKSADALRLDVKNRNNATEGANEAIAKLQKLYYGGKVDIGSLATSADVKRQEVEKQLSGTLSANVAAKQTQMSNEQIEQSINTGKDALVDQFIKTTAKNAAGVSVANYDVEKVKADNAKMIDNQTTQAYVDNLDDLKVNPENAYNLATKRAFQSAAENNIDIPKPDRQAIFAAAESKQNAEAMAAEVSKMKDKTKNYDIATMAQQLSETNYNDDPIRFKALVNKLATSGGYGQKTLAEIIKKASDSGKEDFVQNAAEFMQKDSDVTKAINAKNPALAQYLREVNNGTTSNTTSFENWFNSIRGNTGRTNAQFVVDEIVDKDQDLVSQSDGAFKDMLNAGVIDDNRLSAIYNNSEIYNSASKEVRERIADKLGRPYDQAEYNASAPQNDNHTSAPQHSNPGIIKDSSDPRWTNPGDQNHTLGG